MMGDRRSRDTRSGLFRRSRGPAVRHHALRGPGPPLGRVRPRLPTAMANGSRGLAASGTHRRTGHRLAPAGPPVARASVVGQPVALDRCFRSVRGSRARRMVGTLRRRICIRPVRLAVQTEGVDDGSAKQRSHETRRSGLARLVRRQHFVSELADHGRRLALAPPQVVVGVRKDLDAGAPEGLAHGPKLGGRTELIALAR